MPETDPLIMYVINERNKGPSDLLFNIKRVCATVQPLGPGADPLFSFLAAVSTCLRSSALALGGVLWGSGGKGAEWV